LVESSPDPEVPAKRRRRNLTAAYKLKILQKIDECNESGQVGALLRREGLYSSNITRWRKQRDQGLLTAMSPKKRGRKKVKNPMTNEVAKLQKENEKLRKKLWQAEKIIEVQKKISEILSIEQNLDQNEESDS
jgi:transposase-like protein